MEPKSLIVLRYEWLHCDPTGDVEGAASRYIEALEIKIIELRSKLKMDSSSILPVDKQ